MLKETLYAHAADGDCISIHITLAKPIASQGDWGILLEINSSDGKLNFSNTLYQVSPLLCLDVALKFISTMLDGYRENTSTRLSFSKTWSEGSQVPDTYPR